MGANGRTCVEGQYVGAWGSQWPSVPLNLVYTGAFQPNGRKAIKNANTIIQLSKSDYLFLDWGSWHEECRKGSWEQDHWTTAKIGREGEQL